MLPLQLFKMKAKRSLKALKQPTKPPPNARVLAKQSAPTAIAFEGRQTD